LTIQTKLFSNLYLSKFFFLQQNRSFRIAVRKSAQDVADLLGKKYYVLFPFNNGN